VGHTNFGTWGFANSIAIFLHFSLEGWTQADMGFDFCLGFMLQAYKIFLGELCHKQFKPKFLFTLFQASQGSQLFFELLISVLLGADLVAFVALGD
jgi:hypothetical protein